MFFFLQIGTSYPLYRYEIVHITIQKENGKRKAFICTKRLGNREGSGSLFFSFFIFLARWGPGLEDDKRKQKQFTKSQSAKGCIFLQI